MAFVLCFLLFVFLGLLGSSEELTTWVCSLLGRPPVGSCRGRAASLSVRDLGVCCHSTHPGPVNTNTQWLAWGPVLSAAWSPSVFLSQSFFPAHSLLRAALSLLSYLQSPAGPDSFDYCCRCHFTYRLTRRALQLSSRHERMLEPLEVQDLKEHKFRR